MRTPKVGDLVLFHLRQVDAERINEGRDLFRDGVPPTVFVGNPVDAGDVFPMMITRVWEGTPGCAVNGQVMLDGNDLHWVTSVNEVDGVGDPQGCWRYRD